MKKFNKNSIVSVATVIVLVFSFVLGLNGPTTAHAATAPNLGVADPYSIFGKSAVTNTGGGTHIWGNVGADLLSNITGLIGSQVDGTIAGPVANLQTDATTAYTALNAWTADGAKNLSTPQTVTPGVYTVLAGETLTGAITLNGAGVYIFRSSGAYTVANGASVLLTGGATACNVFWQIPGIMTIGTTVQMVGTIITNSGAITLANSATLKGRALSLIANVTLDTNQVTAPCATAPAGGPTTGTINVVKTVINNSGRTKIVADFPLFVNGTRVTSGVTNTFPAPANIYTVTETLDPNYTQSFSGDCDINGQLNLRPGDNKFCIVTNNDIGTPVIAPPVPALMELIKTASPLSLPNGPGPVTYTYTLRNIGVVPIIDITIVGDTCSPIIRVSGDTNNDNKLDVSETWVHTCIKTISATHTNNAVATGWANGVSTVDIASATVVVGAPIVPPLIHVVTRPNVFALSVGGGTVIYTYTITNPGTAPLSNVTVTDDKCTGLPSRVLGQPGDLNQNDLLESNEVWSFTCQSNLTQTTINTGTVVGSANGLTARDFALSTVTVAAQPSTTTPTSLGFTTLSGVNLREGDTVSATGSNDPDIYIANSWGYKRLFLNPIIFSFYGHLGGFASVKTISPLTRAMLVTSSLFRNCETNDPKVYGVEVTGEDTGTLHWINTSGAQAIQEDPDFFKKVFCINSNEFNWYSQGSAYTSVNQVPTYSR